MFSPAHHSRYAVTGVTPPIYVASDGAAKVIAPGEGYFVLRIRSAQAAFRGTIWERVKSLVVTSQISVHHQGLGAEPVRTLQKSIPVERNRAEQLGLRQDLIHLTPAVMPGFSVSIDFILDTENRLAVLADLINNNTFWTAVSLAPATVAAAKTVGAISQKLIQTLLRPGEGQAILRFSGDFQIVGGLREGCYVILGSRDESNPLPQPPFDLELREETLFLQGERVTQLSYVVLEVICVSVRGRASNDGAAWDTKLRQAEAIAATVAGNPLIEAAERTQSWKNCFAFLKEAQTLLVAEPNYLASEARDIIKAAFAYCSKEIFNPETSRNARMPAAGEGSVAVEMRAGREQLQIAAGEDLAETVGRYADQVASSRRHLRQAGVS